jgi:hypothetical protein
MMDVYVVSIPVYEIAVFGLSSLAQGLQRPPGANMWDTLREYASRVYSIQSGRSRVELEDIEFLCYGGRSHGGLL